MNNTTYALTGNDLIFQRGWERVRLFRDMDNRPNPGEVDAMVASGDCFITLATKLDEVTESLPVKSFTHIDLEKITAILIYLQQHYKITKKSRDLRQ